MGDNNDSMGGVIVIGSYSEGNNGEDYQIGAEGDGYSLVVELGKVGSGSMGSGYGWCCGFSWI